MGCSSSNTLEDNPVKFDSISTKELISLKENFIAKQKAIDDLISNNREFDDQFKFLYSLDHDKFEESVDLYWNKFKALLDPNLFTKESFKDYTLTVASQSFIIRDLQYKEYNIAELVNGVIKDFKMDNENLKIVQTTSSDLLKNIEDKFPERQKGFMYFVTNIKSYCFSYGHINNNFKYNNDFQLNVFNFVLIGDNIENIGYIRGIAEIIEANTNLVSVCMQLYDNYNDNKPFDKSSMKNICIILNAIQNNTNIKALVILQTKGENSLEFGNEVIDKISELIKKDFLYFIYFFRLSFNSEFGQNIGRTLPNLKNLKFLGIYSNDNEFSYLDDILQGVSKNNSLNILIIQKYEISESKINEFKALSSNCKTLRLFKYFK